MKKIVSRIGHRILFVNLVPRSFNSHESKLTFSELENLAFPQIVQKLGTMDERNLHPFAIDPRFN